MVQLISYLIKFVSYDDISNIIATFENQPFPGFFVKIF